jgi:redox-sensitive bicupin YhaK (pirin superfamily)
LRFALSSFILHYMIQIRNHSKRGHSDLGWLSSYHSFSFADYYDPRNMGFRALRVINDDRFAPGSGFGTHPHQDMEIITYVLEGAVEHKDSVGNSGVIRAGEVQRMSAGTGIRHSEYNASNTDLLHLLQIWILPDVTGIPPSYEQKVIPADGMSGKLQLIAAKNPTLAAVKIHQDMQLFATVLHGETVKHAIQPQRHAWIQVARGHFLLNGNALDEGDGAAISGEAEVELTGDGEALLFDLS